MLYGNLEITPAEWLDWKKGFVTQSVFATLSKEREEWATNLVNGNTLIQGKEVVDTARTVGVIYGLDCILIGLEELLREQWEEKKGEER